MSWLNLTNEEAARQAGQRVADLALSEYEARVPGCGSKYLNHYGVSGSSCTPFFFWLWERVGRPIHRSAEEVKSFLWVPTMRDVLTLRATGVFFSWRDWDPRPGDALLVKTKAANKGPGHLAVVGPAGMLIAGPDGKRPGERYVKTIEAGYTINKVSNCLARDSWGEQCTSNRFVTFFRPLWSANKGA